MPEISSRIVIYKQRTCILGQLSCLEEMALPKEVLNLTRDKPGLFLRDRGIPYSSRNKGDRLTLATNALEQDIPLTPSVRQDLSSAEDSSAGGRHDQAAASIKDGSRMDQFF